MKKIILSLLICGLIGGFSINLIFADTTTTTVLDTTTTTVPDTTTTTVGNTTTTTLLEEELTVPWALGLKKVGLLPTSPFYFLKEWWRGWKVGWIKDPIKKSEVQLQILSEKLAEAEEISQKTSKIEVLEKAFENYTNAMDKLKTRLEELKETSGNPNIDNLLNKITEAEIRHSEVLDRILERVPQAVVEVERIRQNINQILPFLRLKFENQEEFMNRLENKLQELQPLNPAPAGEFRQLRIMESMQEQLMQADLEDYPDHVQDKTEQLKAKLENRIQQRIQVLEKQGFSSSTIDGIMGGLPVPTPKISPNKLPKTPPPGANMTTTTTTVVSTTTITTTTTVPDTTTTTTVTETTTTTVPDTTTTTTIN
jgi:hypothetical protein